MSNVESLYFATHTQDGQVSGLESINFNPPQNEEKTKQTASDIYQSKFTTIIDYINKMEETEGKSFLDNLIKEKPGSVLRFDIDQNGDISIYGANIDPGTIKKADDIFKATWIQLEPNASLKYAKSETSATLSLPSSPSLSSEASIVYPTKKTKSSEFAKIFKTDPEFTEKLKELRASGSSEKDIEDQLIIFIEKKIKNYQSTKKSIQKDEEKENVDSRHPNLEKAKNILKEIKDSSHQNSKDYAAQLVEKLKTNPSAIDSESKLKLIKEILIQDNYISKTGIDEKARKILKNFNLNHELDDKINVFIKDSQNSTPKGIQEGTEQLRYVIEDDLKWRGKIKNQKKIKQEAAKILHKKLKKHRENIYSSIENQKNEFKSHTEIIDSYDKLKSIKEMIFLNKYQTERASFDYLKKAALDLNEFYKENKDLKPNKDIKELTFILIDPEKVVASSIGSIVNNSRIKQAHEKTIQEATNDLRLKIKESSKGSDGDKTKIAQDTAKLLHVTLEKHKDQLLIAIEQENSLVQDSTIRSTKKKELLEQLKFTKEMIFLNKSHTEEASFDNLSNAAIELDKFYKNYELTPSNEDIKSTILFLTEPETAINSRIKSTIMSRSTVSIQEAAEDFRFIIENTMQGSGKNQEEITQESAKILHKILEQHQKKIQTELQMSVETIQKSIDELEAPLNKIQAPLNEIQVPLDKFQASKYKLQASLDKLQAPLDKLQASIDELQASLDEIQLEKEKNDIYPDQEELLETPVESRKEQLDEIQLEKEKNNIDSTPAEPLEIVESRKEQLEKQIQAKKEQFQTRQAKKETILTQLKEIEKQITNLQTKKESLLEPLQASKDQLYKLQIERNYLLAPLKVTKELIFTNNIKITTSSLFNKKIKPKVLLNHVKEEAHELEVFYSKNSLEPNEKIQRMITILKIDLQPQKKEENVKNYANKSEGSREEILNTSFVDLDESFILLMMNNIKPKKYLQYNNEECKPIEARMKNIIHAIDRQKFRPTNQAVNLLNRNMLSDDKQKKDILMLDVFKRFLLLNASEFSTINLMDNKIKEFVPEDDDIAKKNSNFGGIKRDPISILSNIEVSFKPPDNDEIKKMSNDEKDIIRNYANRFSELNQIVANHEESFDKNDKILTKFIGQVKNLHQQFLKLDFNLNSPSKLEEIPSLRTTTATPSPESLTPRASYRGLKQPYQKPEFVNATSDSQAGLLEAPIPSETPTLSLEEVKEKLRKLPSLDQFTTKNDEKFLKTINATTDDSRYYNSNKNGNITNELKRQRSQFSSSSKEGQILSLLIDYYKGQEKEERNNRIDLSPFFPNLDVSRDID